MASDSSLAQLIVDANGVVYPFSAYYSTDYEPLMEGTPGSDLYLLVTFIDSAYQCGTSPQNFNSLTFTFTGRAPGISSYMVLGRGGPILGPTSGSQGGVELDTIDDRSMLVDGGFVVAPGGTLGGSADFKAAANISLTGPFSAPYCAALDITVSD